MNIDPKQYRKYFAPSDGDTTPLHMRDLEGFDFAAYFERALALQLTPEEKRRYPFHVMMLHYLRQLARTGQPMPPQLANLLADYCDRILDGDEWETVIPLPWTYPTPVRLNAAQRRYQYGWMVHNYVQPPLGGTTLSVTEAKERVAGDHGVSVKLVEAGWADYKRNPHRPIAPKK